jgi:hypothetical protein
MSEQRSRVTKNEEKRRGKAGRELVAKSGGGADRSGGRARRGKRETREKGGRRVKHEDETILRIEPRKLAKGPISRYGAKVSGPIVAAVCIVCKNAPIKIR